MLNMHSFSVAGDNSVSSMVLVTIKYDYMI